MKSDRNQLVLVTRDKALVSSLREAMTPRHLQLEIIDANVVDIKETQALSAASIVVVDLDARKHEELVGLQNVMGRLAGATPVVVLTESFDDAVGRWFLQIRVSDFLRKPVEPADIFQTCVKVISDQNGGEQPTEIITFTSAQGGVGNTTVAVETGLQLVRASGEHSKGTCLVDLDFQNDACSAYLDIEPKLDLNQIGTHGECLDEQMLDIMTMRHSSGLALLAAPAHSGEEAGITAEAVLRLLDIAASRYQSIIIDMPRTWQTWTDDIVRGSDRVYVVTDMTVPGLRCARRMVKRIHDRLNKEVQPKVIVNRLEKQTLFGGGLRLSDVERALEGSYAGGISNNYRVVREAIDRGVPLEVVKQGNSVSEDVRRIIFA